MSEHIRFEKLELDELPDEAHLAACQTCAAEWEAVWFLRLQLKAAPKIDAPPFFAARVARRALQGRSPFIVLFERAARRLVPLFLTLVVAMSLLLMNLLRTPPAGEQQFEVLFQQPAHQDISMEYVVNSLREPNKEAGD